MNMAILLGMTAPAGVAALAAAGVMALRGPRAALTPPAPQVPAMAGIVFADDDETDNAPPRATVRPFETDVPAPKRFAPLAALSSLLRRRKNVVADEAVIVEDSGIVSEPVPYTAEVSERQFEPEVEPETVAPRAVLQNDGFYEVFEEERDPNLAQLQMVASIDAQRYERERELELERRATAIAEAEAQARGHAWSQTWWVRLDPELDADDTRARRAMASSLGRTGAPWAVKLVRKALEQEEDASVRARLLGALVRLGATDDWEPFRHAEQNGNPLERAALQELFGDTRPWMSA